jgi:DNA-binding transcriptional LysR family regulator
VTRLHAALRSMLKINVPMSFGHMHIVPALPSFLPPYPEVNIDMRMADHFVDVIDESYDVAIRVAQRADSSLISV